MANTTNFGWETPDDTDLVKDGALAMRTLGNAIDTSFVDLKGGTTGQNLRKNSNTDLDFVWAGDATNTVIDAEGDLLVGDSADTLQRLAIGTTGQVLTVDTTLDGKIKWAAPAGGGKVLQVVSATYGVETTSTSTAWADTGLSASITPSANTSKILVMTFGNYFLTKVDDKIGGGLRLLRGSTFIFGSEAASSPADLWMRDQNSGGNLMEKAVWQTFTYLDSPSTTSSTTYKIQFAIQQGTMKAQNSSNDSTIILMEIGA